MSNKSRLVDDPSELETLTGNSGGPVSSDVAGNIDIVGAEGVVVTGNPGTNTLTITDTGSVTTYNADSGSAVPAASILNVLGGTFLTSSGAGNTLTLDLTQDTEDASIHGWNGSIIETDDTTVSSDGATITLSVEKSGGGDLTVVFSDGFYAWDTTPAVTVTLTAGSDTAPQSNYIYFLQSTKTLTNNTVGFPAAEHAPIATVICQSAASLQTNGAYKVHVWTDHIVNSDEQGHISDLNSWIRDQPATWISGVTQTYTITTNVGTPDNVLITTNPGVVRQLHNHTFPAFTGTPDYYVINDSVTPYTIVNDLNSLLTDSTGASMSGKFFSLVLWGVVSEDTGDSKIFINLPSGSYNNSISLEQDINAFADFSIPSDFVGTGFLISQWNLRHQVASGGTWTSLDELDLRGLRPSISPGGTTASPTEFADNLFRIFEFADVTKKLAFEIDQLTTATTRTITMADYDIDMATVVISAPTDSGTATPSAGALTFAGSGGIATSGAGSTVTIDGSAITDFDWNIETGTSDTMAVDNGYVGNNAGTVTFTLPDTAAFGTMFRVTGLQGAWVIAQNAGDTIHFGNQSTTTGVGGSLASTHARDVVLLLCVVANTDFQVLSSVGNITVT